MSAYIQALQRKLEREQAEQQLVRDEQARVVAEAVRERLVPLEVRLRRLLDTVPAELQREGLSLASLQASLRGRWRGSCHPGELGTALRRAGYTRTRLWSDEANGFRSIWRKQQG